MKEAFGQTHPSRKSTTEREHHEEDCIQLVVEWGTNARERGVPRLYARTLGLIHPSQKHFSAGDTPKSSCIGICDYGKVRFVESVVAGMT